MTPEEQLAQLQAQIAANSTTPAVAPVAAPVQTTVQSIAAKLFAQLTPEQQGKVVIQEFVKKYKQVGPADAIDAVSMGIVLMDAGRKQFFVPSIELTPNNYIKCRVTVAKGFNMSEVQTSDTPQAFTGNRIGYEVEGSLMAELTYVECLDDIFSVEPVLNRATGEFEANKLIHKKGDHIYQLTLV